MIGLSKDDAVRQLKDLGVPAAVITDHRWGPKDTVSSQTPPGGAMVHRETPVAIHVSNGEAPVPPPPPRPDKNPDDGSGDFGVPAPPTG